MESWELRELEFFRSLKWREFFVSYPNPYLRVILPPISQRSPADNPQHSTRPLLRPFVPPRPAPPLSSCSLSVAPLARSCRLPLLLLLLLLVAQLLDGAHRTEHHLGRQLGAGRTAGLAAGGRLAVQRCIRIGVGVGVRDVVVVEVATAAALMRHVARDVDIFVIGG